MALNSRRSRPISVDGVTFRWTVSNQQEGSVILVIQPAENGQRIAVKIPFRDYWSDLKDLTDGTLEYDAAHYQPVTPSLVERCIRAAKLADWNPGRSATQLDFEIVDLLPEIDVSRNEPPNEDS